MSIEELISKSIQYSSLDLYHKFEKDCDAKLIIATSLRQVEFHTDKECVVLHKIGGGAIPYKKGAWVLQKDLVGSFVTIGVYKKHQ